MKGRKGHQINRIAITQPYVPAYRFALWDLVITALKQDGLDARVFYGGDRRQLALRASRGDGVAADWAEQVPCRTIGLSTRLPRILVRKLPTAWRKQTLLLTEMQANNAEAWAALFRGRPYVTFGHGKSETSSDNPAATFLKTILNKRAAHVLTYSEAGRADVLARTGLPPYRVTSFQNSTDTRALENAIETLSSSDVSDFQRLHGIPSEANVALFVGALNEHKRLDLLASAAEVLFEKDPQAWLIVAGDGKDRSLIMALAKKTGRVTFLGQSGVDVLARASRIASLIVNPGRIGLVAVDALAMKLPILSSTAGKHAPEADYLVLGESLFVADATASAIADQWHEVARKPRPTGGPPTVEHAARTISMALEKTVRELNGDIG